MWRVDAARKNSETILHDANVQSNGARIASARGAKEENCAALAPCDSVKKTGRDSKAMLPRLA